MKLPESLRPILWSYDFERLDTEKHKKTIIEATINYGTLVHWQWLKQTYGRQELQRVLQTMPAAELKPRARRLAGLIFGVAEFHYAPRGAH